MQGNNRTKRKIFQTRLHRNVLCYLGHVRVQEKNSVYWTKELSFPLHSDSRYLNTNLNPYIQFFGFLISMK